MFRVEKIKGDHKVYANIAINKGTEICEFRGDLIDYHTTIKLGKKESFALQISADQYLFLEGPFRFFNHCCEPNCGLVSDKKLIAIKDIPKNEELRWDYSTSMLEHHWQMKCECHKKTCRQLVGDFVLLPKKLQDEYLKMQIVQDFIVDKIRNNKKP